MSEKFLNLAYIPNENYHGVKIGENRYLNMPQGTTTEEFKEYLKEYEPDIFVALEKVDNKLKNMQTPQEDKEMIFGSPSKMLKAVNPRTIKNGWQKFETFILNKTKKPPRVTVDELNERYEKGKEIINNIRNEQKEIA